MKRIKHWIIERKFIRDFYEGAISLACSELTEADRASIYTKAFEHARKDLEETNKKDIEKKAKELSDKRLQEMLSIIDYSHVLSIGKKDKRIYLGNEPATDIQVNNLKAEAEFLVQSSIWKVMHEIPKELAQRAMFVEGDSLDSLKKGRSILFTLDSQKRVVDILSLYGKKE